MAALVIGSDLGLANTSLATLGLKQGNAAQGQSGENVTVNLASGNLVVQQQDELLIGLGVPISTLRTYNSQGVLDGDNNDNWRIGFYRQLSPLRGDAGAAGNSINRIAADGASETYVWDGAAACYVCTAGGGTYRTLTLQPEGLWLWSDGNGTSERYQCQNGSPLLLRSQSDANGNTTIFEYFANGLLHKVVSPSGETTELVYDTAPGRQANLLSLRTYARNAVGATLTEMTRVRYGYDALNRLAQVTVDLTPSDNSIADGNAYVTRYTWEGDSLRISSMAQSDGSKLAFAYDSAGRVISMSDALGATTRYIYEQDCTTVVDPLGNAWRYSHDAKGQVTRIESPAVGGIAAVRSFTWNDKGDLQSMVEADGTLVQFEYDAMGNQTLRRDAIGESRRTYNARNQLLSETLSAPGNSNAIPGTRYVYDASGLHLRFVISAEGRVTQLRYNGLGQRESSISYSADMWRGATQPDEAGLSAWAEGLADKSQAVRTDYRYDFRGQLASSTVYSRLDRDGNGVAPTAATTLYVYDAAGRLLQTVAPGAGSGAATSQVYDGLGRILARTNALGQTSSFCYFTEETSGIVGSALRIVQTAADGSLSSTIYDRAGNLIAQIANGSAGTAITRYSYDANGRLCLTVDASGVRTWLFYDAAGRKSGQLDGNGSVTEFHYDERGNLVQTTGYAQVVSVAGNISTLEQARPQPDPQHDRITRYFYDAAGRLSKSIEPNGALTENRYDEAGRLQQVTRFANAMDTATLATGMRADAIGLQADAAHDRSTRYVYDRDGLLRATVDAEGYVAETLYDAAGRAWQTVAYANPARNAAALDLDALRPPASDADARSFTFYDARGLISAQVDAEGYLTSHEYDAAGNRIRSTRYATALAADVLARLTAGSDAALLQPIVLGSDQTTTATYDALNRIIDSGNAEGTHTRYQYDAVGNIVVSTVANGTKDASSRQWRFDAQGLLLAELDGEGSAALAALGGDASADATRYWSDRMGQKTLQVDAQGFGTAWRYDAGGHVVMETRFAQPNNTTLDLTADGAALAAAWPASGDDRISTYRYDRNGRMLEERHANVAYGQANGAGTLANGTADAVTTYAWNGLGLLVQKIDATGSVSNTRYDSQGRKASELGAAFTDFEGNAVRSRTDFIYNGLSELHALIARGRDDATDLDDRITFYVHGLAGRLLREVNPMGAVTSYDYDAAGNVIAKRQDRINADGASVQDVTLYRYDGNNREIEQTDVGTGTSRQIRYTAWGEVSARGTNGGWQEFAEYDGAGRLVKGNAGDGVTRAFVYDAAGNATLKIESSGVDLRALTLEQMLQIFNGNVDPDAQDASGVHLTISAYDRRNQLTDTWQPKMVSSRVEAQVQASSSAVQMVSSSYTGVTVTATASDVGVAGVLIASGKPDLGTVFTAQMTFGSVAVSGVVAFYMGRPTLGPLVGNLTLTVPDALDAWGPGNFKVIWQPQGEGPRTLYFPGNSRVLTISGIVYLALMGGSVPVSLYKTTGNGDLLVSQFSISIPNSWPVPNQVIPRLAIFRAPTALPKNVMLYYRASNSAGPFQSLNVRPYLSDSSGMYAFDWSTLPRGSYEVRMLAISPDGTVQDYQTGGMTLGADTASINITPATYGPAVASSMLFETGNLLQLTAQGSTANSMVVSYRVAGSNSAWNSTTVLKPSSASGAVTPGWFTWNYGQLAGDYEIVFESHKGTNGDGDLINKVYTTLRLGGASPSILVQPVAYQHLPSTIQFSGNPLDAAGLTVRYRILGSGSAWSSRVLTPTFTGSGTFGWDASDLVPYDQSSFRYEFEYEARNASGLLVNKGGGSLQLGVTTAVLSQYVAPPSTLLRFTPLTPAAAMRLYYRPRNSTASFTRPIELARAVDGSYSWDAMALKPATGTADFEYFYELVDAQGQELDRTSGYFSLGTGNSANALQWVINGASTGGAVIHRQQSTNAFGDIAHEVDGLGRVTDYSYNTLGLLTQKLQPTNTATLENGYIKTLRPETRYSYDLAGHAIAEQDANGMLNTQAWLPGGVNKTTLVRQADGSLVQYGYDIFGDLRSMRDGLGRITTYEYDRNNRLIRLTRPLRDAAGPSALASASVDRYEYDQAGNRVAHVNALNQRERTYYDSLGRVTRTLSFESRATTYDYRYADNLIGTGGSKTGGSIKTTTDANGRTLVDSTDLFGHLLAHQDLGGHSFSYRYNAAGWLVAQTGSTGQNINYEYYANGLLRGIRDLAAHTLSTYEYDAEGNKTFEGYALLGTDNQSVRDFAQQASIQYDELNRVKTITDPRYSISYEYDAVGNRRHMLARYHDGVNGSVQEQDYWYAYDAANRFVLSMGSLSAARARQESDMTVSIVTGKDGVQLAYDLAGQRRQATYLGPDGVLHTERYTYTADGYLEDAIVDGVLRARRKSDALGRVVNYTEFRPSGNLDWQRGSVFDADGLLTHESTLTVVVPDNDKPGSGIRGFLEWYQRQSHPTRSGTTDYYRQADGTLAYTVANSENTTTTTWYGYEWWDSARQSTITSQPYNASAPGWMPGTSHLLYDVNGHLLEARDEVGNAGFRYQTNAQGLILRREEYMASALRLQNYYYLDGKRVGDVGNGGPSRVDYVQALAASGASKTGARSFQPIASADFDQNYEPINAAYPGATPGTRVVQAGDTLRSIASQLWGDAGMWYLIADANGLSGDETLEPGIVLTIPNKVTNFHNTSQTFRVYSPGEAIGDVMPNLPAPPPPPQDDGWGFFGTVLAIAIAVVVTIYTAGVMAEPSATGLAAIMSAGSGALGSSVGISLVAGAAGSLASQGVGMALGMQSQFSWTGVALSSLGAGVGAGIAGPTGIGATVAQAAGLTSQAAIAATSQFLGNVLTQGIATAVNLQQRFDWRAVAAATIGAAAGSKMGDLLGKAGAIAASISSRLASGITRGAMARGGLNWGVLAGEALGNSFGMVPSSGEAQVAASISTGIGPVHTEYQSASSIEGSAEYAAGLGVELANAADRLHVEIIGGDDSELGLSQIPSAMQRFVDEYVPQHPEASPEEVQQEYDRTWAEQSDSRFRRPVQAADSADSLRPIGAVEGFFTFTPAGRLISGVGNGMGSAISGLAATGKQAVLTAQDAVAFGLSRLDNAMGGNLTYTPQSVLGQSVRQQGAGPTALNVAGGLMRGAVDAPLGLVRGMYYGDARLVGENLPGAVMAAGSLLKSGTSTGLGLVDEARLNGQLYGTQKLVSLGAYLQRRGITLKVGDEFLPPGYSGGFSAGDRSLVLRSNPTNYEVWHEVMHFRQYRSLGEEAYSSQPRTLKEQFVFDRLESMPKRWGALTPEEMSHARWYIDKVGGLW